MGKSWWECKRVGKPISKDCIQQSQLWANLGVINCPPFFCKVNIPNNRPLNVLRVILTSFLNLLPPPPPTHNFPWELKAVSADNFELRKEENLKEVFGMAAMLVPLWCGSDSHEDSLAWMIRTLILLSRYNGDWQFVMCFTITLFIVPLA